MTSVRGEGGNTTGITATWIRIRGEKTVATREQQTAPYRRACQATAGIFAPLPCPWDPPCVTFHLIVVSLRGPGQSPFLPSTCCVGSLLSVGRCSRCSCWCCFRICGAQCRVFLKGGGVQGGEPPPPADPEVLGFSFT